jgi:hypothetical protein
MKLPWWVWGIGIAGVGYLLYRFASKIPQAASAATNAVSQGIANIWLSLPVVGLGSGQTILGNARLPDGTLVPLNNLIGRLRQDDTGNTYANISGTIYQLSPSDAQGNYPAALLGPAPAGG